MAKTRKASSVTACALSSINEEVPSGFSMNSGLCKTFAGSLMEGPSNPAETVRVFTILGTMNNIVSNGKRRNI